MRLAEDSVLVRDWGRQTGAIAANADKKAWCNLLARESSELGFGASRQAM